MEQAAFIRDHEIPENEVRCELLYLQNHSILDSINFIQESIYRSAEKHSWLIDSGATSYCSSEHSSFTSLERRRIALETAGANIEIATEGRGDVSTSLPNGQTLKLSGVLLVPRVATNILSTQALYAVGIYNSHTDEGYKFFDSVRGSS